MNTIRLIILVDNNAQAGCSAEHGFALWLETADKRILFDAAQNSNTLLGNAKALGIDLTRTDTLILSHGHYDHTGGIGFLLEKVPGLQVYFHPDIFSRRYAVSGENVRSIGITPQNIRLLQSLENEKRIHPGGLPVRLTDHVFISGEIPRITPFESPGENFFLDATGREKDHLYDDISLYINTAEGLLICTGCCHAGIVNTLTQIQMISGKQKIHTLLGGLHLHSAENDRIDRTIEEMKRMSVEQIIGCHCTGDGPLELLSHHFSCTQGFAGMELKFFLP